MDLVLYGVNHKTAPIEIRERISFKLEDSSGAMSALRSEGIFHENLLLSTCNRTEIYGVTDDVNESLERLIGFLAKIRNCDENTLREYSYEYLNIMAVRHLFKVSAGLDSLVLGETEILKQIKDAYKTAVRVDATGPYLNKLFQHCFRVGKRVRTETDISCGNVSVSSCAVALACKVLGNLQNKRALLIGTGETGQLVAQNLVESGIKELVVTNRTMSKAEEVSRKFSGKVLSFDQYPSNISKFDLVITAIGAPEYIIKRDMLKPHMGKYPLLIDLGVPRDIDPDVNKINSVFVYHIDDFQAIVNEQIKKREKEIPKAESIIEKETAVFINWVKTLDSQQIITELHKQLYKIRDEIISSWKGRTSPSEYKLIERVTGELINKILAKPTVTLKECGFGEGVKKCEECEMFDNEKGCTNGSYDHKMKCIIARMLFGLGESIQNVGDNSNRFSESAEKLSDEKRWST